MARFLVGVSNNAMMLGFVSSPDRKVPFKLFLVAR